MSDYGYDYSGCDDYSDYSDCHPRHRRHHHRRHRDCWDWNSSYAS